MPNQGPWPYQPPSNQPRPSQPQPDYRYGPPQQERFNPFNQPLPPRQDYYPPPTPQPTYLYGKIIDTPKDIKPNDVPGDGSVGIFPLKDYSAIVARAWNDQGTFDTVVYIPDKPQIEEPIKEDPLQTLRNDVFKRLDQIEQLIMESATAPTTQVSIKEETK